MNKEILKKIDEIINLIENSPEYQKYLSLRKEMDKDQNLTLLINEIRVLQKDVVHHLDKKDLLMAKEKELNNSPLYREYCNILFEINNYYAIIENSLNNYFQSKLN